MACMTFERNILKSSMLGAVLSTDVAPVGFPVLAAYLDQIIFIVNSYVDDEISL